LVFPSLLACLFEFGFGVCLPFWQDFALEVVEGQGVPGSLVHRAVAEINDEPRGCANEQFIAIQVREGGRKGLTAKAGGREGEGQPQIAARRVGVNPSFA
jgi:hypothetical protein